MSSEETGAAFDPAQIAAALPKIPKWDTDTLHVAQEDLEFVPIAEGVEVKVVHVDLKQGLWVVFNRFHAGAQIPPHYHTGQVFGVTLQGKWYYKESPDEVNSPGSYIFEPAGSTHTLIVPEDQEEPTIVWFAIYGCNVNLDENGELDLMVDAATMLNGYRMITGAMGFNADKTIVVGED